MHAPLALVDICSQRGGEGQRLPILLERPHRPRIGAPNQWGGKADAFQLATLLAAFLAKRFLEAFLDLSQPRIGHHSFYYNYVHQEEQEKNKDFPPSFTSNPFPKPLFLEHSVRVARKKEGEERGKKVHSSSLAKLLLTQEEEENGCEGRSTSSKREKDGLGQIPFHFKKRERAFFAARRPSWLSLCAIRTSLLLFV